MIYIISLVFQISAGLLLLWGQFSVISYDEHNFKADQVNFNKSESQIEDEQRNEERYKRLRIVNNCVAAFELILGYLLSIWGERTMSKLICTIIVLIFSLALTKIIYATSKYFVGKKKYHSIKEGTILID